MSDKRTIAVELTDKHIDGYSNDEYNNTHNTSTAGKLIRAQAEQIRETPAEYVARKYGIRGDADDGRADEEDT